MSVTVLAICAGVGRCNNLSRVLFRGVVVALAPGAGSGRSARAAASAGPRDPSPWAPEARAPRPAPPGSRRPAAQSLPRPARSHHPQSRLTVRPLLCLPAPKDPEVQRRSRDDKRVPDERYRHPAVFVPALHRGEAPAEVLGDLGPAVEYFTVGEVGLSGSGLDSHWSRLSRALRVSHGSEATATTEAASTSGRGMASLVHGRDEPQHTLGPRNGLRREGWAPAERAPRGTTAQRRAKHVGGRLRGPRATPGRHRQCPTSGGRLRPGCGSCSDLPRSATYCVATVRYLRPSANRAH